jgi:hypothetical protein
LRLYGVSIQIRCTVGLATMVIHFQVTCLEVPTVICTVPISSPNQNQIVKGLGIFTTYSTVLHLVQCARFELFLSLYNVISSPSPGLLLSCPPTITKSSWNLLKEGSIVPRVLRVQSRRLVSLDLPSIYEVSSVLCSSRLYDASANYLQLHKPRDRRYHSSSRVRDGCLAKSLSTVSRACLCSRFRETELPGKSLATLIDVGRSSTYLSMIFKDITTHSALRLRRLVEFHPLLEHYDLMR